MDLELTKKEAKALQKAIGHTLSDTTVQLDPETYELLDGVYTKIEAYFDEVGNG